MFLQSENTQNFLTQESKRNLGEVAGNFTYGALVHELKNQEAEAYKQSIRIGHPRYAREGQ